ncbi:hypothetical protein HS088_TW06G00142 [Tripterygium wilfordii]|uniref:Late embryogenesis abundant protein LEA-2 subgroup domain-containing protein n=1 Tax=Tripterygium wilfordii TaxID=458696 RepID=A0A7J7DHZ8_TRIWF|nr:NDR1/HIN1-like protein 6 [Tripterygium wilfordii]KAF5745977.1 hypothetical protein HS088_TW06G00142 [Tripterygium wilfordii]
MDPSKYYMLNNDQYSLQPPPHRRKIPRYHSHQSSGGNCCLRCICCCCCTFIILIIVLTGLGPLGFLLYAILQPQRPVYSVSNFGVQAFDLQPDFSLYTKFVMAVKAENPNEQIGFIYGKDGLVVVSYQGSKLCFGKIPNFRQPGKNTSMLNIVLKGKSEFGNGLQEALMDNRNSGKIPLLVQVKAPVTVVVGEFPLREVIARVNNSLVVDNLTLPRTCGLGIFGQSLTRGVDPL